LEGGPPSFAPGFSFRALLRNSATTGSCVRLPGSHRLWPSVPGEFTSRALSRPQVLQPRCHKDTGLGLDPFRSPLLRTSRLISLPPGTEMFQFPGFASALLRMTGCNTRRVTPFGHLRITACVPLPGASRSLPRPSSPLCAQASPTCLLSLDYNISSSNRTTRIVSTSDVFLRKCHLNKGFIIPRSTMYVCCQIAKTLDSPRRTGSTIESGGQNVSRRSDYEMRSLIRGRVTSDPLRR
jgi:hypothetical protein